jgi:soluble lytic murein transglycosylase
MAYLLFLILAGSIALLDAPGGELGRPADATIATPAATPRAAAQDSAEAALERGRFFQASRLYHEILQRDTTPEIVLAAARAAIGIADWEYAERLLAGRAWLDAQPTGWELLGRARFALERWEDARDALSRALAAADRLEPNDVALARVRLAYALGQLDDPRAAREAFDQAIAAVPPLVEWLNLFAALAAARAGHRAATDDRLAAAGEDLAREWGWRARVDASLAAGDTAAAIAAAELAAGRIERVSRRADAWNVAASLRAATDDEGGARDAYRRAMQASQGAAAARAAARAFTELGELDAADLLLVGRTLVHHGEFERGTGLLRAYIQAGHGNAAAREALRYELGDALFRARRFRDAESTLLELARMTSNQARAASAHFLAGRSQYRDGRQAQGRTTFETVASRYAGEAAAVRALYFAADLLHDDAEYDRARTLYRRAFESGRGDVEEVGLAAMRLGGLAWIDRDYAAALRHFDAYRTRFPRGRLAQQATYWAGRAHAALGDAENAGRRMNEVLRAEPLSYYASLAADFLGRDFPAITFGAPPPVQYTADIDRGLHRVDLLRTIGWHYAADFESERLRHQYRSNDAALYTLAEALNQRGITSAGIAIGWELHRRNGGWNDRLARIIYPFPFRDLIEQEAERRSVDTFLAAGLIRQESMFHAGAVSPAGAIGLMQVMPETGRQIAANLGFDRFSAAMLTRPEINVQLGMTYLADLLRSHPDRIDAALAGYNAGPHRVDRWRQFPEWNDPHLFAERIPFAETRGYVKIVQTNARIYHALYGLTSTD